MSNPKPPLCEVCGKRPAVAVVVVQHLAVNVCKACYLDYPKLHKVSK